MSEGGLLPGPLILSGVVGSTAHGLALPGTDDRDEMGVCVESPRQILGLERFEHLVHRTAAVREGKPDARSQPGDTDLTIYGLQKYCRLALKGNPTILILLHLPEEEYMTLSPLGNRLRAMKAAFATKRSGRAFLGYLEAQKARLFGERGQKRVQRPELEEKHGYDTKYAMHMLRLAYQGIEYMESGALTLPMEERTRDVLMTVRRGEMPLAGVLHLATRLEAKLKKAIADTALPDEPTPSLIDMFLVDAYERAWRWKKNGGKGPYS